MLLKEFTLFYSTIAAVPVCEQPNAPLHLRRWQHCGARRVATRGGVQSRAQVEGRASGVSVQAVVRLPKEGGRSNLAPLWGISRAKVFT
jgi:hypothetical protein